MFTMTIAVEVATTRFIASRLRNSGVRQNTRTPLVSRSKKGAGSAGAIFGNLVAITSAADPMKPRKVPTKRLL